MSAIGKIVILGAGESGVGAAILAKTKGYSVFVSDYGIISPKHKQELEENELEFEEGTHTEARIFDAQLVVKSPGIPEAAPLIKKLKERNIPVISEIEFAAKYTNAVLIGITGTNGKTTTTMLTYHILQKAGLNVGMAGNVGFSFARQVALTQRDYYVLELSSFQLDGMFDTRLDYAVLLNITPDHLDRYDSLEHYAHSKFRVAQNQTSEQKFIYCLDDESILQHLETQNINSTKIPFSIHSELNEGAYIKDNTMTIKLKNQGVNFSIPTNQITISGKHNQYNSMAAAIIANSLLIRKESIRESLSDFKNVEHRLEHVAKVKGMTFINDSKATNVNSAWYALESMKDSVVWIAGGVDKGNDYAALQSLVKDKVRIIICLGKNNMKLHQAFQKDVDLMINASSAKEAVDIAYHLGIAGETVLLSPACASFDLFTDYQDRGNQFKQAVREL